MDDVTGTLANGNQFRLSPSAIDVSSPTGAELYHLERPDISMYARFGNSLRIVTPRGFSAELPATSDSDARLIEDCIKRIRSGSPAAATGKHAGPLPRVSGSAGTGIGLMTTAGDLQGVVRPAIILFAAYVGTLIVGLALISLVLAAVYG